MMRKNTLLNFIFVLCAGSLFAAPTISQQDVREEANKVFQNGATLTETVLNTQKNYAKWHSAEIADIRKSGVKFSGWRSIKAENGDPAYSLKITSPKAMSRGITIAIPGYSEVVFNGEKIFENKGWGGRYRSNFALNLKAGENELRINYTQIKRDVINRFHPYYAPYSDIKEELKNKFWGNGFGKYFKLLGYENEFEISERADFGNLLAKPLDELLERSMFSAGAFEKRLNALKDAKTDANSVEWLKLFEEMALAYDVEHTLGYDIKNVKAAVNALTQKYKSYPREFSSQLAKWEKEMPAIKQALARGDNSVMSKVNEFKEFASKALLADPRLKKLNTWVFIKRKFGTPYDGLPSNWQGNALLRERQKWHDEIWEMQINDPKSAKVLFSDAEETPAITDMDIEWDGEKIMFSSLDKKNRWQIYEIDLNKKDANGKFALKMLSPGLHDSVDNYDGVYLPNGKIVFCSTACWVGVPCVGGADYVGNLYVMNPSAGSPEAVDKSIRQLTFEQDADWMPTVMNDGRVMYTRWEYTDNSHYFARILMRMNPDGTSQSSYYGSTSFWPNSIFYTRQIPNSPTKFVSIVSGHHGTRRSGELHLFDTSNGTHEEQGRVHKFPSYGREYVAKTMDTLVDGKWPQMLHPYPVDEDLIVVSARTPDWHFALYLVDKYDNMTLLQKADGAGLYEPMPLASRKKPSVIPDLVTPKLKANPKLDKGYIFLNDIYQGPGLSGVPRGEVKALRIYEYDYAYRNMGAHDVIGQEGSWDVKRIHGTVPVEEDGSAIFEVPANRPIALQPLDKDGKALALMRSWLAVMPGETQSCVGCHEDQYMTPVSATAMASRKAPSKIKPFRAEVRGYSFLRDVQPILDKYCAGCHDGTVKGRPNLARSDKRVWKHFTSAYMDLHPFVRRSGPESTQNLLPTAEFAANTSELVQMLKKGHHGVELDKDAWDVLYTWMDLNVPFIGSWKEVRQDIPHNGDVERRKYLAKYANRFEDPDLITWDPGKQEFIAPKPEKKHTSAVPTVKGFPFDEEAALAKVKATNLPKELVVEMGEGQVMRFSLIPAGSYVMGTNSWFYDEGPASVVKVDKPFYMATFETTNAQYNVFDKNHNSAYFDRHWKDHVNRGYPANLPEQSVVRISWQQAMDFCKWMSEKYGLEITLPTEAQWEWAARAGSNKDFWFGEIGSDFAPYENLSDVTTKKFAVMGIDPQPIRNPSPQMAFVPADLQFNDGQLVTAPVGSYAPSPFNLYDINGNVAEWTLNDYTETLGGKAVEGVKVARGGSWRDRSKWARVTVRRNYPQWQRVYNVGFRVVINDAQKAAKLLKVPAPLPKKEVKFSEPEKREKRVDESMFVSSNPYDLIINGDFEYPVLTGALGGANDEDMPGWSSTHSYEMWQGGEVGSPKTEASGKKASQHIELGSGGEAPYQVWQTVTIPKGIKNGRAILSFDTWQRRAKNARVEVFVNGKKVASQEFKGNSSAWTTNTLEVKKLNGGSNVKILFIEEDEKNEALGWHLDNVKFVIQKK